MLEPKIDDSDPIQALCALMNVVLKKAEKYVAYEELVDTKEYFTP
jgi:hypothetical protein